MIPPVTGRRSYSGAPERQRGSAAGSPRVRASAARLAGDLDVASLRPQREELLDDLADVVRTAAREAVAHLTPSGRRKTEIFRTHGGYASLKAHRAAEILYDATVAFCNRFVDRRSRTREQMVQAARSGKQNIVEGSVAAGTSSKTEIRLIGVARASLEERLADYRDFLRQKGLPQREKDDPRAQEIRRLAFKLGRSSALYRSDIEADPPEVAGSTAICLVCQATYQLDRLKRHLEQELLEHSGIAERTLVAPLRRRERQGPSRRELMG